MGPTCRQAMLASLVSSASPSSPLMPPVTARLMWHATPSESRIRPYLEAGAGIKLYQGTGAQVAYQPLRYFALLTQQQDLRPLVSAGGGVKFQISTHVQLRLDVPVGGLLAKNHTCDRQ